MQRPELKDGQCVAFKGAAGSIQWFYEVNGQRFARVLFADCHAAGVWVHDLVVTPFRLGDEVRLACDRRERGRVAVPGHSAPPTMKAPVWVLWRDGVRAWIEADEIELRA